MERKVLGLVKKYQDDLSNESKVPSEMSENEVKAYLKEVVEEFEKSKA